MMSNARLTILKAILKALIKLIVANIRMVKCRGRKLRKRIKEEVRGRRIPTHR
jgi:hypothetical protein